MQNIQLVEPNFNSKLAQLVIVPVVQVEFEVVVDEFNQTSRGNNGFGSTDVKNI
jgi:dUTPase